MGDNIRLKGPLGLKQDLYDDKRAKEFKRIFQLTPKEIIAEFEKKEADVKKEVNGGSIKIKKALFGKMISNTATASPEGASSSGGLQLSGLGKMFGNLPLGFFKPANENEKNKGVNTNFFMDDEKGNRINIGKKDGGLIRQGFPKVAKKGWK